MLLKVQHYPRATACDEKKPLFAHTIGLAQLQVLLPETGGMQ